MAVTPTRTGSRGRAIKSMAVAALVLVAGYSSLTYAEISAGAQDHGSLDPTFGGKGIVTLDLGGAEERATGLVVQPDGKIVVSGLTAAKSSVGNHFTLIRYNPDGSLDESFGAGGLAEANAGGQAAGLSLEANDIALQPDGKIVVAGRSFNAETYETRMAVARYNADGSLDETFGRDGVVLTQVDPFGLDAANAVAIAEDGKIVLAGGAGGFPVQPVVLRYNQDGSLDRSFANGGVQVTNHLRDHTVADVAIQGDGKIVVAGSQLDISHDFSLLRYNRDGSLDETFGEDGHVSTDLLTQEDWARALAIRPDGKIVVGGYIAALGDKRAIAVAQYKPDGSLDESFGNEYGRIIHNMTAYGWIAPYALALRADGKLVLAGSLMDQSFAVALYNADGSRDESFANGGVALTDFGPGDDRAFAVAIQPDGSIVAAGDIGTRNGETQDFDFALARYRAAPFGAPTATPTAPPGPGPEDPAACDLQLPDDLRGRIYFPDHWLEYACRLMAGRQ